MYPQHEQDAHTALRAAGAALAIHYSQTREARLKRARLYEQDIFHLVIRAFPHQSFLLAKWNDVARETGGV